METWRLADLHAYVDDCLEPDERQAFENRMAQDPALARRAAAWRAQNGAIRAALDGEGARAFSISIVRHQNEIPIKGRRPATVGGRPPGEQPARSSCAGCCGRPAIFGEGRRGRRISAVALVAARARGVVRRPCLRLGACRNRRPRQRTRRGRRCGFSRIRPPGRCAGRTGDQRQDRIGSVADDAAHASRPPPRDSFRRQPGRSADRSLSWRGRRPFWSTGRKTRPLGLLIQSLDAPATSSAPNFSPRTAATPRYGRGAARDLPWSATSTPRHC